jgi:hypothetical protein
LKVDPEKSRLLVKGLRVFISFRLLSETVSILFYRVLSALVLAVASEITN